MSARRCRPLLLACIAGLSALFAPAARDACAQQVVLTNTSGLDFGRFVAGTGGTVIVTPAGLRSRTGGVTLLSSPATGQAAFNVGKNSSGATSKAVIITLPANGSIRLTSGANSMAVGSFVSSPATLASIPNGGTILSIGATLTVAPNQAPGSYSGSFPLIVNFQ